MKEEIEGWARPPRTARLGPAVRERGVSAWQLPVACNQLAVSDLVFAMLEKRSTVFSSCVVL